MNIAILTYGAPKGPYGHQCLHNTLVLQWSEQHFNKYKKNNEEVIKEEGTYSVEIDVPGYMLNSGKYKFMIGVEYVGSWYYEEHDGIIFELFDDDSSHNLKSGISSGLIAKPLNWKEKKIK